jgi:hypothetical protein
MERDFTDTNQAGKPLANQCHDEKEAGAAVFAVTSNATQEPDKESSLVGNDNESIGLVGATIFFTPEPSLDSSPYLERHKLSHIVGLYSGHLNEDPTFGSGMEGALSRKIASSLDGGSTTEYEILDGSCDLEDLSSGQECPSSTVPSLNCGGDQENNLGLISAESPLNMFKKKSSSEVNFIADWEPKDTSLEINVRGCLSTFPNMVGQILETEIKYADSFPSVKCKQPPDTFFDETRSPVHQSQDLPKTHSSIQFVKVKEALVCFAASIISFFSNACTLVSTFVYGLIASIFNIVTRILGRIRLHTKAGRTITQNDTEAVPQLDDINKMSPNNESGLTRTELLTLFSVEALKGKRIVGPLKKSLRQFDSREHEQNCINDAKLDQHENANLNGISDMVAAGINIMVTSGIVTKCKEVIPRLKFTASRFASISPSFFICTILMYKYPSGIRVFRGIDTPSVEEDNLHCVLTKTSSFISVPLWLWELDVIYHDAPDEIEPRVTFSIMTLLFFAFILKSKFPFPLNKPKRLNKVLTGILSEEEHSQLLEGNNMHGSCWKLVSAFLPTCNHDLVMSHGSSWIPARKLDPPCSNTPDLADTMTSSTLTALDIASTVPVTGVHGENLDMKSVSLELEQVNETDTKRALKCNITTTNEASADALDIGDGKDVFMVAGKTGKLVGTNLTKKLEEVTGLTRISSQTWPNPRKVKPIFSIA